MVGEHARAVAVAGDDRRLDANRLGDRPGVVRVGLVVLRRGDEHGHLEIARRRQRPERLRRRRKADHGRCVELGRHRDRERRAERTAGEDDRSRPGGPREVGDGPQVDVAVLPPGPRGLAHPARVVRDRVPAGVRERRREAVEVLLRPGPAVGQDHRIRALPELDRVEPLAVGRFDRHAPCAGRRVGKIPGAGGQGDGDRHDQGGRGGTAAGARGYRRCAGSRQGVEDLAIL